MPRNRNWDNNAAGYPEYVPVSEKRARNRSAVAKLRKKRQSVSPVVIEGRSIANSWWGKSWNANLERYADYSNRIGRGRSYVRHGAVLDLHIEPGVVHALVQGSRVKPYAASVEIEPLSESVWERLRTFALTRLDSMSDLLAGKFPESLQDAFFARGDGLFPTPDEIDFRCSCPDWASMCKHVAAVLYGIGNRLDQAPELLFSLRRVSMEELLERAVDDTAETLLDKARTADADDVLEDANLGDVFGIELSDTAAPEPRTPSLPSPGVPPAAEPTTRDATKNTAQNNRPAEAGGQRKKPLDKTARPATKSESVAKTRRNKPASSPKKGKMINQLMQAVPDESKSFRTGELCEALPKWSASQVSNTIQRAVSEGRIQRVGHGRYQRKPHHEP